MLVDPLTQKHRATEFVGLCSLTCDDQHEETGTMPKSPSIRLTAEELARLRQRDEEAHRYLQQELAANRANLEKKRADHGDGAACSDRK